MLRDDYQKGKKNLLKIIKRTVSGALSIALVITVTNYAVPNLRAWAAADHNWTYTLNENDITAVCDHLDDDGTCTIANQTITLRAEGKVYNGTPVTVNLEKSAGWITDNGLDDPEIVYSPDNSADVGDYSASITIAENTVTVNWSITKATPSVTVTEASDLTYNGAAQALLSAHTTSGGTLQYKVGAGDYSETAPTGTAAGTYTVYYKVVGGDNYNDVEEASTNVTIAPKEIGLEWSNISLTYNGNVQVPGATATGLVGDDTCVVTVTGGQTAVGSYTATASSLSNSNYALPAEKATGYSIVAANMDGVSVSGYTGTYDKEAHKISVTAPEGATVQYKTAAEGEYGNTNPEFTDAGDYTVYYKISLENYNDVTSSATVSITQKEVGLSWSEDPITYTGSALAPEATATGVIEGDTCDVTVTVDGDHVIPGNYTATATGLSNANYKLPTTGLTHDFAITKATWEAPEAPTATSVSVDSITLNATAGYEYKLGDGDWQASATFDNLTAGTTYTFYQRVTGDDNHNASPSSPGTAISTTPHTHSWIYSAEGNELTIACENGDSGHEGDTSVTLTINAPERTIYDGEGDAEATIAGTNPAGDNPAIVYKRGDTTLDSAPTDAGIYTANITLGEATASVEYTIEQKAVGISWTGTSFVYDGNEHAPTATATGLKEGDTCTVTVTGGQTNAGDSYTATAAELDNANYKLPASGLTQVFEITKATWETPEAPTAAGISVDSVTLNATDGYEYRIEGGEWQDSPEFSDLQMNTGYTFYQRVKGDANHNESAAAEATISTNNHVHEWENYTASGATITATCADSDSGHGAVKTASITIVAPALTVYGSEDDANATILGSISGVANPDIVYKNGEESLDEAPTGAGTYTASITLEGVTATVEYTIAKASAPVLTAAQKPTVNEDLIYTGSAQALVTAPETPHPGEFTIKYAVTENTTEPNDSAFTTEIPEETNTGTYYVWYKAVDSANYEDTEASYLTVIIAPAEAPAPLEAEMPAAIENLTYIGAAQALITGPESALEGYTVKYRLSDTAAWSTSIPVGTNAATYSVQVMYEADANHTDFTIESISVDIDTMNLSTGVSVTYDEDTFAYRSEKVTPEVTVRITEGNVLLTEGTDYDLHYAGVNDTDYDENAEAPTTPGEYKAIAVFKGNYSGSAISAFVYTIERTTEAPVAQAKTITYSGVTYDVNLLFNFPYEPDEVGRTFSIVDAETTGEGSLDGDSLAITGAGTFTIKVVTEETATVAASEVNSTLTVNKATPSGTITVTDITYGETLANPTVVPSPAEAGSKTVEYKKTTGTTWSAAKPTAAGSYQARVIFGENDLYNAYTGTTSFTISQADLTVTADAGTKVRDSADPALTYTVSGLENGDTAGSVLTGALSREAGENVGTYAITQGTLADSSGNYDITFVTANFTITKAIHSAVTVDAANAPLVPTVAASGNTLDVRDFITPGPDRTATFTVTAADGTLVENSPLPTVSGSTVIFDVNDSSDNATGSITVQVTDPNYENYSVTIPIKASSTINYMAETRLSGGAVADNTVSAAYSENLSDYAEGLTTANTAVEVKLDVEKKAPGTLTDDVKDDIVSAAVTRFAGYEEDDLKKAYLDINVRVYTGSDIESIDTSEEVEPEPDTGTPIEIALNVGTGVTEKNPVVVRVHDTTLLFRELSSRPTGSYQDGTFYVDKVEGIVYIYSQYFSTYSLVYADTVPWTVTFDSAGGSAVSPLSVKDGASAVQPSQAPVKSGYTFVKWLLNGSQYNFSTAVHADITLTAQWSQTSSGSSGSGSSSSGSSGSSNSNTSSNSQASNSTSGTTAGSTSTKTSTSGSKATDTNKGTTVTVVTPTETEATGTTIEKETSSSTEKEVKKPEKATGSVTVTEPMFDNSKPYKEGFDVDVTVFAVAILTGTAALAFVFWLFYAMKRDRKTVV